MKNPLAMFRDKKQLKSKEEKDAFMATSVKNVLALKPALFRCILERAASIKIGERGMTFVKPKSGELYTRKESGIVASMAGMLDEKINQLLNEDVAADVHEEIDILVKLLNRLDMPAKFAQYFVVISDGEAQPLFRPEITRRGGNMPGSVRLFMPVKLVADIENKGIKFPTGWATARYKVTTKNGTEWECVFSCIRDKFEEEGFDEWVMYFKGMMSGKLNSVIKDFGDEAANAKKGGTI